MCCKPPAEPGINTTWSNWTLVLDKDMPTQIPEAHGHYQIMTISFESGTMFALMIFLTGVQTMDDILNICDKNFQ